MFANYSQFLQIIVNFVKLLIQSISIIFDNENYQGKTYLLDSHTIFREGLNYLAYRLCYGSKNLRV